MSACNVLFVCTGNSARSILSEATLNHLGHGEWRAYSAGSRPTGQVNPHALAQLERSHIPATGLASKSWDQFTSADGVPLDIVITVCDSAAAETCPVLFGDFLRSHWGLPDPAAANGSPAELDAAFAQAHRVITHRLRQLVGLPRREMTRDSLQAALDRIGHSLPT